MKRILLIILAIIVGAGALGFYFRKEIILFLVTRADRPFAAGSQVFENYGQPNWRVRGASERGASGRGGSGRGEEASDILFFRLLRGVRISFFCLSSFF
jgi:hypothetical protein